ncbi:LamG domain-containing protein [Polaribacter vadi]|uniref:LamG domain-containing protein n=1 Tax=Polaribacter TaxID=52959 RepID=UPI001C0A2505|nr:MULTISPECIES: LamG domain-containing protein [Polaribacter]MBU3012854.1 LamG domain-containing protein [Polaribacter vadi]MDO6742670.1 LamG domain-containing protein [Polaribacter sp. 1_MG-2023]
MKIIKLLIIIFSLGLIFVSCSDDPVEVYPGIIVRVDTVFVKGVNRTYPTFTGSNTSDDRFYAFSGGASTDLSSMSGEDFTYETWIKVDSDALIGSLDSISGKTAGGANIMERGRNFELYLVEDSDADFAIKYNRLDDDNLALGSMNSSDSSINLNFDEWAHIAISRSSSDNTAKFYINGVLIDSSTDDLWIQPVNDTWLDFNYMYRGGNINFFKGSFDNIRVSYIDRYPTAFIPNQYEKFAVDSNTLLQMDLDENLTPFEPATDFDKVEIKGVYSYYIQVINTVYWTSEDSTVPTK